MADIAASHVAYLSVGSNMGEKVENCLKGLAAIDRSDTSKVLRTSKFYRTSPVDYKEQDWFVNAAVKIGTTLEPLALLEQLADIQQHLGRKKDAVRFGPRVLDLDILLFDDRVIQSPRLEIPHPRMHKRAFVLQPICDIDPAIVHPVLGMTVSDLLNRIEDEEQRVIPLETQPVSSKIRKT